MTVFLTLVSHLAVALAGGALHLDVTPAAAPPRGTAEALVPNDNRTAAGTLANGVLTLRLVARDGTLFPDGPGTPGIPVFAFGEEGKPLQAPGPLIRVAAGTELRVTVRNALAKLVRIRGLQDHSTAVLDTFDIAPGATREIRFRANTPGAWFYWGRTSGSREGLAPEFDSHLVGAFIVDPPGMKPPANERVLVIESFRDTVYLPGKPPTRRELIVLNGLSWPHTERLHYTVGDTVRWRVLNAGFVVHPMHLHGFYFRVDSKGDATRDTIYTDPQRRTAVTENMPPGTTMSMTWVPTRPGNWLFHCHLIFHIDARMRLADASPIASGGHTNHAEEGMAGLVVGVEVAPLKGTVLAADPVARRKLRLFVNQRANVFGDKPGFSFVLQEGTEPPAADSIRLPSSTIVLHRGEPTEITVINRTTEMSSTHWHGIELESFYDGVSDWSGWGTRTAPVVAPGDSFIVRMTPDRAGTFIYHTHTNETVQLTSGLYGPLIVLPEGGVQDTTDRIFLLGDGGPGITTTPFINGRTTPAPIELRASTTHRFRLINISSFANKRVRLMSDSAAAWRPFAKDGYDLPSQQATMRPAIVTLGPGETMDFEVRRDQAEVLSLEIVTNPGARQIVAKVPVIVR